MASNQADKTAPRDLVWDDLPKGRAERLDEKFVGLTGWMCPLDRADSHGYFLFSPEPVFCFACRPCDPLACVEVFTDRPLPPQSGAIRLSGRWKVLDPDDPAGWRFQLVEARLEIERYDRRSVSRRSLLAAGPLLGLAACGPGAPGNAEVPAQAQGQPAVAPALPALTGLTIDIHTHAGGIIGRSSVEGSAPFGPLADPMRAGGLATACLAMVADSPVTHVLPDGRIQAYRRPSPGEFYAWSGKAFARMLALTKAQNLALVTDTASLHAARGTAPSVIMAAEGADFLEGRLERLEEARRLYHLRHLQLTHFRVNELGDIQTEAPVHGGLTDFGAEVVREANRLGIVVDVAHGTFDLVKRVASVTSNPLVLSHSSLSASPGRYSRTISPDHARLIAATGGVIGVWPPLNIFPSLEAMAVGMARLVDVVGVDHVGLGSDMLGLPGGSIFRDYSQLPALDAALAARGLKPEDRAKIMGGNYARVFAATVG